MVVVDVLFISKMIGEKRELVNKCYHVILFSV